MVEGKEFRELMLQVVRTRMAFRRSMQRTLKKNNAGITFEMLQILSCLWHEQGITQQVLAERTAKDKACLTNLMNNLEKKGYVHRKEDPEDRRNKLVFLTPEGEEFKKQIRPILDQVYVHAEHIIGIENVETMLSELKAVYIMSLRIYKKHVLSLFCMTVATFPAIAQTDSLFLTIDQLFERGVRHSLQIQADVLKESIAQERTHTARSAQLPDLQIGLKGGYVGQPILFEQGLAHPTRPEAPDWSQNYAIDLTQPIYQGGKIRYSIRKADLEKEVASLQTLTDQSDIKLGLLNQYIGLFSLFKQREVLSRNIEESERRLQDIRRMKKEGLITNNDVLRSEMQLTNDRLSLQETDNSLILVSQQLDILIGLDENLLLKPDTTLLDQTVSLETYEDYVAQAYSNDPAIRLLRKQTELAQNDIRLTKASSLPSLSLYASNTLARPVSRTLADMYNNNWNIGLSLSYPLSSLYKNNHKIKESKWMVSLHKNEEEQKKQKIRMEVRTAFLRHKEALQEVEALKLSVRQAQENYRIMQNRYLNQLAILTDLLDANSVLLNAELQLTNARTHVIYTYYQLQKACGRL